MSTPCPWAMAGRLGQLDSCPELCHLWNDSGRQVDSAKPGVQQHRLSPGLQVAGQMKIDFRWHLEKMSITPNPTATYVYLPTLQPSEPVKDKVSILCSCVCNFFLISGF